MSKKRTNKQPRYPKHDINLLYATRQGIDELIDNISVDNVDIREVYDDSMKYINREDSCIIHMDHINRIMVNTIRHEYSNYDDGLKRLHKIKYCDYYDMYKDAVLDSIAEQYPSLRDECNRQKRPIPIARKVI